MRWLFALMLLCLAYPAQAQNVICATAPNGDSTNKCASTAFVQNAVSSGTSLNLTQYHLFVGNVSGKAADTALAGDCTYGASGVVCTKTNGTDFGTFATQNYATPPAIGGTTPNAGSFNALTLSTITGSSQCLQVNSSGVVSGTGVGCVSPTTLAQYHFLIGNVSNVPTDTALSGDCTYGASGIVCTKTNGVNLGTFATQNYATPPAIGGVTPNTGAFTTLSASSTLTTNVTGTTQCLQVNSSGVVSGTGGACGGGGFWTANVNDIYNNNSGNVGIGNNTPAYKLDVTASASTFARFTDNVNASLYIRAPALNNTNLFADSTAFTFSTQTFGEVMRMTSSGTVGIGTTSITGKLDVYGPSASIGCCSPLAQIMNIAQGSSGTPFTTANTPGVIISRYEGTTGASGDSSSEPALLVWEQASGTNQPNAIVGRAYVTAAGNADAVGIYGTAQSDSTAAAGKSAYAAFFTSSATVSGTHAVLIGTGLFNNTGGDDSGFIGLDLGYSSPNHGGTAIWVRTTDAGEWSNVIKVSNNLHSDAFSFTGISVAGSFLALPTTGLSISGFGASSAGNQYLCFNTANNQVTYNGTACNPSDARLKDVEGAAPEGLGSVLAMRPVRFAWRDAAQAAAQGPQIGLLAQDIARVVPEAVGTSEVPVTYVDAKGDKHTVDKPLNIDYAKLVVPLISAVQQLFYLICGLAAAFIIGFFCCVIWVRSVRKTGVPA